MTTEYDAFSIMSELVCNIRVRSKIDDSAHKSITKSENLLLITNDLVLRNKKNRYFILIEQ